jgi:S-adenosylmethionine decarboxylase
MDLTRSSTAQEEDHRVAQRGAHEISRKDFIIEREGVRLAGTRLIVDLSGARRLDDIEHIKDTLKRCAEAAGATLLHIHLHHFTPNGGVSGVAVLAESHISIHSWPEASYAALDVFMCGDADPHACIKVLREAFSARDVVVKTHRGPQLDEGSRKAAEAKPLPAPVRARAARKTRKAA